VAALRHGSPARPSTPTTATSPEGCSRVDLGVAWGTTVGDDRAASQAAFQQAAARADVVIVNGGLGPAVDDLS
jgi:molybdopterin-biosynthesis enzyme MoeA-like protein